MKICYTSKYRSCLLIAAFACVAFGVYQLFLSGDSPQFEENQGVYAFRNFSLMLSSITIFLMAAMVFWSWMVSRKPAIELVDNDLLVRSVLGRLTRVSAENSSCSVKGKRIVVESRSDGTLLASIPARGLDLDQVSYVTSSTSGLGK